MVFPEVMSEEISVDEPVSFLFRKYNIKFFVFLWLISLNMFRQTKGHVVEKRLYQE